jgi:hypothetical protein
MGVKKMEKPPKCKEAATKAAEKIKEKKQKPKK